MAPKSTLGDVLALVRLVATDSKAKCAKANYWKMCAETMARVELLQAVIDTCVELEALNDINLRKRMDA